jgi:putative membrane protein
LAPVNRDRLGIVLSALLSALHLLALAVGLPSVFFRGRALAGPLDEAGLRRLFAADSAWGIAALLWIGTGLARAFGGLEKGTQFYLASPLFWVKMALLAGILVLELTPMITIMRWRLAHQRGRIPDTTNARRLYLINHAQMGLVILMVFAASFMARGIGIR